MEAIVLAGGLGTRLNAIFPDFPKVMAPIDGQPFLEIVLKGLSNRGFSRVILSLGYKADIIKSFFGRSYYGIDIEYQIEKKQLGTGGAIKLAMELCVSDHVYIFNGDTYIDLDVSKVEALWYQEHSPIIVGIKVLDTARYGRLDIKNRRVSKFLEKSKEGPGYINAGCYVFPKDFMSHLPKGQTFSIEKDFLPIRVLEMPIYFFETKGAFIDIGIPADYMQAITFFRKYREFAKV